MRSILTLGMVGDDKSWFQSDKPMYWVLENHADAVAVEIGDMRMTNRQGNTGDAWSSLKHAVSQRSCLGDEHQGDRKMGFDYVHVIVNDHTHFAYTKVLTDEKGP